MDAIKSVVMFVGFAIFYIADPIFLPGVLFLLAAIILEAALIALCPKDYQRLSPSTLFEAAPVCSR